MIVVADASPFIALIKIELVHLLPILFGKVIVPPEVLAELRDARRPQAVREYFICAPDWLLECSPVVVENIPRLDAGETAAIHLAQELRAELLLIDEAMTGDGNQSRHSNHGNHWPFGACCTRRFNRPGRRI
jgi:predicted nucleic acid-binding protein